MHNDQNTKSIVKLQSDQFIVRPVSGKQTIADGTKSYEVDLARQNCQCKEFCNQRKSFPIGDPRRFCTHLVAARCESNEKLQPFLQSLLEAHDTMKKGMPNGSSFAFFEIDGRLSFYCESRDQTCYFFLTGESGSVFHEFHYDRKKKKWTGEAPESPEQLVVFAFKERGQYVTQPKTARRARSRSRKQQDRETPSAIKYLILLLTAAGLITGGAYLFQRLNQNSDPAQAADQNTSSTKRITAKSAKKDHPKTALPIPVLEAPQKAIKSIPEVPDNTEQNGIANAEDEPTLPDPAEESQSTQKPAEFREWRTSDSQLTLSARYKFFQNGKVVLEREDTGERVKVDESQLRSEDQAYVKQIRRERRIQRAKEASHNSEQN